MRLGPHVVHKWLLAGCHPVLLQLLTFAPEPKKALEVARCVQMTAWKTRPESQTSVEEQKSFRGDQSHVLPMQNEGTLEAGVELGPRCGSGSVCVTEVTPRTPITKQRLNCQTVPTHNLNPQPFFSTVSLLLILQSLIRIASCYLAD